MLRKTDLEGLLDVAEKQIEKYNKQNDKLKGELFESEAENDFNQSAAEVIEDVKELLQTSKDQLAAAQHEASVLKNSLALTNTELEETQEALAFAEGIAAIDGTIIAEADVQVSELKAINADLATENEEFVYKLAIKKSNDLVELEGMKAERDYFRKNCEEEVSEVDRLFALNGELDAELNAERERTYEAETWKSAYDAACAELDEAKKYKCASEMWKANYNQVLDQLVEAEKRITRISDAFNA